MHTVEPVLKDYPFCKENVIFQDRWSLVTGSIVFNCGSLYQKGVVFQDRWSFITLLAVVS